MNKKLNKGRVFISILLFLTFLVLPVTRYNIYVESVGFSLNLFLLIFPVLLLSLVVLGYGRVLLFLDRFKFLILLLLSSVALADFASSFYAYNVDVTRLSFIYRLIGYLFCWSIFSIIYWEVNNRESRFLSAVWWGIVWSSFLVSVLGFWQFHSYEASRVMPLSQLEIFLNSRSLRIEGFTWEVGGNTLLRPSSTFFDPNNCAGFISASILINIAFLTWLLISRKKSLENIRFWWGKVIAVVVVLLCNIVLFCMLGSRSAILGLSGALLAIAILLFMRREYRKYVVRVGGGALGFVFVVSILISDFAKSIMSKFINISDFQNTSDANRLVFAQGALEAFRSNIFHGIGVGNFEEFFIKTVNSAYSMAHTHSAYLTFLSETGLYGFVTNVSWLLFLLIVSILAVKGFRKLFVSRGQLLLMSLLGVVISVSLGNIFYGYYPTSFWVWGNFGLLLGLIRIKKFV